MAGGSDLPPEWRSKQATFSPISAPPGGHRWQAEEDPEDWIAFLFSALGFFLQKLRPFL
jgi:hypothetical protein